MDGRKKEVKVASQVLFPETGIPSEGLGLRRKVTSLFCVCGDVFEIVMRRKLCGDWICCLEAQSELPKKSGNHIGVRSLDHLR